MGHGVAPIGELELLPPRVIFVHALLYPMEPRVFQPLLHDTGFVLHAWSRNQKDPDSCPINSKVVRNIATAFGVAKKPATSPVMKVKPWRPS